MKCKEFVFLVSSGQMPQAPTATRMAGRMHRYMCGHCRAFEANDQALSRTLNGMRERQWPPVEPDATGPTDATPSDGAGPR